MDRGQRPGMAGVQRLQQIERFAAAHLADDDAVGAMPQGRAEQLPNGDGWQPNLLTTSLEPHQVRPINLEFRRVLDEHDSVVHGEERGERVQERGLARTRPAADQDVLVSRDRIANRRQYFGCPYRHW